MMKHLDRILGQPSLQLCTQTEYDPFIIIEAVYSLFCKKFTQRNLCKVFQQRSIPWV